MLRPSLVSSMLMSTILALMMPDMAFSYSSGNDNVVIRDKGIEDCTVMVGFLFHHEIPDDAFTGDIAKYEVRQGEACSEPLPPWLDFDQSTKTFTGFTKADQVGSKTFICVKAIGKSSPAPPPSVAKDVFSVTVDVGLTPDFACPATDSVVLATVYVDVSLPELSNEEILKVLNSVAEALDTAPEKIRFTRLVSRYNPERNPILFSGKGDAVGQKQAGARIQFQVGCSGDAITADNPFVQFLKQKAPTGELSRIIGYPVMDWVVHKGFPRGNARRH